MRRTLLALVAGTALLSIAPAPASASHACAEGFEVLCTRICIGRPINICIPH